MSTYFTDFEEYTTGVFPSDWTARINADDTWTVQTTGSDKYLYCVDPDTDQLLSWNEIDGDANRAVAEVLFKYQRVNSISNVKTGAFARLSGNSSSFSGYRVGGSSSNFQIYVANAASSWTSLGSVSFTAGASGVDHWVRFQANGTTLRARIWEDSVGEPTAWTGTGTGWAALTVTDSAVSAAGWVGVRCGAANAQQYAYWQVGVGTNGDTAPTSGAPPAPTVTLSNLEGYDITSSGFKLRLDYDFA